MIWPFSQYQKARHQENLIQLLRLSTMECDDKEVLEFNFGNHDAHFVERDFALVIGMKFCHHIGCQNSKIEDLKINDILTKYHYRDEKDRIKMALLHFLNSGFIGLFTNPKLT